MKKYFMIIACAFVALSASAQRASSSSSSFFSTEKSDAPITFGITAGVNFANMSFSADGGSYSPDSRTAFNVGLTVDFPILESLYIKSGLLYSSKGYKIEDDDETYTASPAYLEIPILASYRYNFSDAAQLQFNVGPYVAYGIGGKYKYESDYYDEERETDFFDDDTNKFDLGLQFGLGLTISQHFNIGVSYQLGLTNVFDEDGIDVKNRNLMINLGYTF